MNITILAIDVGKFKSVACVYDKISNQAQFESVTTMRAKLVELIQRHRPGVIIIEACVLCGWVHDLGVELGVSFSRARPIGVAASRGVDRFCCASCWSRVPGAACVTRPGSASLLASVERRQSQEEAGDHGAGAEDSDSGLGDAARRRRRTWRTGAGGRDGMTADEG